MHRRLLCLVVPALAVLAAACSANESFPITVPPAPPDSAPPITPETDAGRDSDAPPPKRKSCAPPLEEIECASVDPAPTSDAAIDAFLESNALPLRCELDGETVWDPSPLVELYGSHRIFMIGEVHGSNEIGIVSGVLAETLGAKGLVNIVASELPMDFEPYLQRYVDTGSDSYATMLLQQYFEPNFFGARLTKAARKLAEDGVRVRVGAVDVPMNPELPLAAIRDVAQRLSSQKAVVLGTLPSAIQDPPTAAETAAVVTYADQMLANQTAICAELTPADCDRLVVMTHALYTSTLANDETRMDELWFSRREEVIYYNLRMLMTRPADRMFLHMGAAHTDKSAAASDHSYAPAGSRMAHQHALTKDRVFSVGPANGVGSVISYGSEDVDLPAEPLTLVDALGDSPAHPMFVSTTRPSATCSGNPLGIEPDERSLTPSPRREHYDGYIHYGKLTPETRPDDTILSAEDEVVPDGPEGARLRKAKAFAMFRARIERKERALLGARALRR